MPSHPGAKFCALGARTEQCLAGMDESRAAMRRRPGSVLDVFDAVNNQPRMRLTDAQCDHLTARFGLVPPG